MASREITPVENVPTDTTPHLTARDREIGEKREAILFRWEDGISAWLILSDRSV